MGERGAGYSRGKTPFLKFPKESGLERASSSFRKPHTGRGASTRSSEELTRGGLRGRNVVNHGQRRIPRGRERNELLGKTTNTAKARRVSTYQIKRGVHAGTKFGGKSRHGAGKRQLEAPWKASSHPGATHSTTASNPKKTLTRGRVHSRGGLFSSDRGAQIPPFLERKWCRIPEWAGM